jgi:glycosyltransferase involved in cell wall biosynthesis
MSKASIDVIIPCYNTGRYLREAIDSVLAQTLLPAKLIVINDGSTDDSGEIADSYLKTYTGPVEIIHHRQQNAGLSAARNAGLAKSTSEFVAFLDADDYWMPNKLKLQMEVFESGKIPNLGLVYIQHELMDEKGNGMTNTPVLQIDRKAQGMIFDQLCMYNLVTASASGVLLTRRCIEFTGHFDTGLRALEDWDYWLRASKHVAFGYVTEPQVKLRSHSNNMQKDTVRMNTNMLRFYKKWLPQISNPEALREWAFQIAKPVWTTTDSKQAMQLIRETFTSDDLRRLFPRTFGSLWLYVKLQKFRYLLS